MNELKKILVAVIITLCTSAILASAKSYIDVERLKVKTQSLFDMVKDIREDVKYIRRKIP